MGPKNIYLVTESSAQVPSWLKEIEGKKISREDLPKITRDGVVILDLDRDLLLLDDNKLESLEPIILVDQKRINLAKDLLRRGAGDFLIHPVTSELIKESAEKIWIRRSRLNVEVIHREAPQPDFGGIIAKSQVMLDIFETAKRLSPFNTTVLITGESGTGKELLARSIHINSRRAQGPFMAINCGAIPETLMESELFGHRKGAFTDASRDKRGLLEEANGGTLFLDEIGEMPLQTQVKLLRALQERLIRRVGDEEQIPIDVRIIAATLRDLEEDVKSGRFRDDLYYRLNVVVLHLPPLRERVEDIPLLVDYFLVKHARKLSLKPKRVPESILKLLVSHYWRGNVRELENCIERALVLSEGEEIQFDALPDAVKDSSSTQSQELFEVGDALSIKQLTRDLEITLIKRALQKTKGNRTHAARVLEISHRALLYKIKEYGLGESD